MRVVLYRGKDSPKRLRRSSWKIREHGLNLTTILTLNLTKNKQTKQNKKERKNKGRNLEKKKEQENLDRHSNCTTPNLHHPPSPVHLQQPNQLAANIVTSLPFITYITHDREEDRNCSSSICFHAHYMINGGKRGTARSLTLSLQKANLTKKTSKSWIV